MVLHYISLYSLKWITNIDYIYIFILRGFFPCFPSLKFSSLLKYLSREANYTVKTYILLSLSPSGRPPRYKRHWKGLREKAGMGFLISKGEIEGHAEIWVLSSSPMISKSGFLKRGTNNWAALNWPFKDGQCRNPDSLGNLLIPHKLSWVSQDQEFRGKPPRKTRTGYT